MVLTASKDTQHQSRETALDRLVDRTEAAMQRVNALILERADSHVEMVPELARYLIDSGGKRLRPMLTLAAAHVFGSETGREVKFAAAVEFMHNATLLHDDVVDESKVRRGQPAARMVWGNQASVLVGDFLLGQAFLMMVEAGDIDALGVLSRAAAIIAEGEVFQLAKTGDLETTADEYHQVIRAKTATLFEAATEVGAMAGGADTAGRRAMAIYGRELGIAFQLVDDVLDYGGTDGTLGKNTGDDLREGKMTLPVILTLARADADERALLINVLGKDDADASDLTKVIKIMARHGALAFTVREAETRVDAAKAALQSLPASDMRELLAEIADFCLLRAY